MEKIGLANANTISIVRAQRLGKFNIKRPRDIIKFLHFKERKEVWAGRTNFKDSGLWMKEDFPKEIVDARRVILPIFRTAKKSKQNVKLNVDRLTFDGKIYTLNNLSFHTNSI